ncbi:hypothetical protein ACFU3E_28860 [Streptomyces sp. NPDC057424]|uniref:hypothetical protein n=1 Tax=Streptomyces sp. NPDC057424 TaxID=3346127 RepID=UPI00367C7256
MPDRGGHREDALGAAHGDTSEGSPAVLFQVELALGVSLTDSISGRTDLSRLRPGNRDRVHE